MAPQGPSGGQVLVACCWWPEWLSPVAVEVVAWVVARPAAVTGEQRT